MPRSNRLLALVVALAVALPVAVRAQTECPFVEGQRMVTRLWQLEEGATYTTGDVAAEFEAGFGPDVRRMDGFEKYVGTVVNDTHNFFFNIFDDETTAAAAQAAAAAFVADGVLDDQIERLLFLEGDLAFWFAKDNHHCLSFDLDGLHLATRYWRLQHGATMTPAEVAAEFKEGFAPTIVEQSGFVVYGAMLVDDGTNLYNFFWNVFTTADAAADANALAAEFVATGVLADQIEKVQFVEASIVFDLPACGLQEYRNNDGQCVACPSYCVGCYAGETGAAVCSGYECSADDRMITRLWRLEAGATFTTQAVADEFQSGFGPIVSDMSGFEKYVGTVVNATHNFFYNVFDNEAHADAAQVAAASFVADGVLDDQIEKVLFLEGDVGFLTTSVSSCLNFATDGYHIATRYWVLKNDANFTSEDVIEEFADYFGPVIAAQPGFIAYGAMLVDDGTDSHTFFFNVFTTADGAASANAMAAKFVSTGYLADEIEKVQFVEGSIDFDISPCSEFATDTTDGACVWCNPEQCLACADSVLTESGHCVDECPTGFGEFDGSCVACLAHCDSCYFPYAYNPTCTECAAGYTMLIPGDPTCTGYSCDEPLDGGRLITRLWRLKSGATYGTDDVAAAFETGFGPTVSHLDGFEKYVGSVVNDSFNFFFNVFDDETTGAAAQTAAASFVADGELSNQIEKVRFLEGDVAFAFVKDASCAKVDLDGDYVATFLFHRKADATFTIEDSLTYLSRVAQTLSALGGFEAYWAMTVDDDTASRIFVLIAMDSGFNLETAVAFFQQVLPFQAALSQLELEAYETATIAFDIREPVDPVSSTGSSDSTGSSASDSTGSSTDSSSTAGGDDDDEASGVVALRPAAVVGGALAALLTVSVMA